MNKIATLSLSIVSASLIAQTQITNGGFENWGNPSPGVSTEPTSWYSNKSGGGFASSGPQTAFQYTTNVHSGNYCVQIITQDYNLGIVDEKVNGNLTTGVVNAPSTTKCKGYIGTVNSSTSSDQRHMVFTDRPDSLVGWYKYTPATASERAKVRAILHTGDYNDPENLAAAQAMSPSCSSISSYTDPTPNKVGDALFLSTTGATVSSWTRFSVPFVYVTAGAPAYIMINITSSADQNTSVNGSTLLLDDIAVVYNSSAGINEYNKNQSINAYYFDKTFFVDFLNRTENQSDLVIYDICGKIVASQKVDNNRLNTIDLSRFNSGIYVYHLSGGTYTKSGKFIVE